MGKGGNGSLSKRRNNKRKKRASGTFLKERGQWLRKNGEKEKEILNHE